MLPIHVILDHFKYLPPDLMDLVVELRNMIAEVAPQASEDIHRNGLTYYDASRGGHVSAGICQILIREDHVRLAFIHGAFLPDPYGLLTFEGERKAKRFIRLDLYDRVQWDQIRKLIRASVKFDPYTLINN